MRKARLQHTALLLSAAIAFCAVSAECRASGKIEPASSSAPCHGSSPAAPAPEGAPGGSVSPPCCGASWSLSSGTASDVPAPTLVAIVAAAPSIHPVPALASHRAPALARGAPPLALYTILRL